MRFVSTTIARSVRIFFRPIPSVLSIWGSVLPNRGGTLVLLVALGLGGLPVQTVSAQQTDANLVTRSGATLAGVEGGASSIADVNNDDVQDLLVAGVNANSDPTATLYLGNGDGTFSEAGAGLTGVEEGPTTSIADVNGDDNLDLLITGRDPNFEASATLYLGNGDGTFSEAGANLTGVELGSVSISDVDGDGAPDILITGGTENAEASATLYLGNGDGSFSEAGANLTSVVFSASSIADVDGDGNQDLLIAGRSSQEAGGTALATLHLGNGDGTFSEAGADLNGIKDGASTSIADVNGDDNLDLLVTGRDSNFDGSATMYLGNGDGTFSEAGADLAEVGQSANSIADFDGDGNQDLLIVGDGGLVFEATATMYLGDGSGDFSEANAGLTDVQSESEGSASTSVGDVHGDGDPDFLITGTDVLFDEPSTRLYVNRTNQTSPNYAPQFSRTFDYEKRLAPGLTLTERYAEAGDPDGDRVSLQVAEGDNASVEDAGNGIGEFTFTPARNQGTTTVDIRVEASDSEGEARSFSVSIDVPGLVAAFSAGLTGVQNGASSIADVDDDGTQDVLITGEGDPDGDGSTEPTAALYLGNGDGSFSEAGAGLTGVKFSSSSIADVNGDDNLDLLITGEDQNFDQTTTLYLGNGDGSFSDAGADLIGVRKGSSSIADVNGDDNPDVLITGQDSDLNEVATLYLGNGDGSFSEAGADLYVVEESSTSIADVNADGNMDLLIAGDGDFAVNRTTLYLGNGDGTFSEAGAGLTDVVGSSTSIADVDADGNLDLLLTGLAANDVHVATLYLGNGDGTFSEAGAELTGVQKGSTSIADVDADGNLDLFITGTNVDDAATATVYLGNGDGTFSEANAGLANVTNSPSTSIGDIDGDGHPDLLATGYTPTTRSASSILYENFFANPIPVELVAFTAQTDDRTIRLSWQTASETNNAGFEVQHRASQEGSWTEIGFVDGAGTTDQSQSYQFTAENLSVGTHQFRLEQLDVDGTAHRSETVSVELGMEQPVRLSAPAPNPVFAQATVSFAVKEAQETTLRLYDVLGQEVATLYRGTPTAEEVQTVDLSAAGLSSGVYFLRLQVGNRTVTERMTVVR